MKPLPLAKVERYLHNLIRLILITALILCYTNHYSAMTIPNLLNR